MRRTPSYALVSQNDTQGCKSLLEIHLVLYWSSFHQKNLCRFDGLNGIDDSRIILFQSEIPTVPCYQHHRQKASKHLSNINDFLSCCSFMYLWGCSFLGERGREAHFSAAIASALAIATFHSFTSRIQKRVQLHRLGYFPDVPHSWFQAWQSQLCSL